MSQKTDKSMLLAALGISAIAIALDRISKEIILANEQFNALECLTPHIACGRIELGRFFDLTMVWNRGISFGLLDTSNPIGNILLLILTLVIALGFALWLWQAQQWRTALPLALIIGGAIGNMIDRIRFGAVIDFLDFSGLWFPFVFNIADSCICVGAGLLLVDQVLAEAKTKYPNRR